MATARQKDAARANLAKARQARSARAHGEKVPRQAQGMSTAEKDRLPDDAFAFPKQRKEPLADARHVRNAIARFDQVEDVSDSDRDEAWRRIKRAAKRCDVEVTAKSWRELFSGGRERKRWAPTQRRVSLCAERRGEMDVGSAWRVSLWVVLRAV